MAVAVFYALGGENVQNICYTIIKLIIYSTMSQKKIISKQQCEVQLNSFYGWIYILPCKAKRQ